MTEPALARRARRVLGILALVASAATPLFAKVGEWNPEPRIDVGVEQQASLLGIPADRLVQAREALVQATRVERTALLDSIEYDPRALMREWERLHSPALDSVIRFRSGLLSRPWDSPDAAGELLPLLAPLVETDPSRLRDLLSARVSNEGAREALLNRIVQHRLNRRIWENYADSDEINQMLATAQRHYPEFRMIFEIRGLLVRQLWIENRAAEGRRIAEGMPDEFRKRSPAGNWLVEDFGRGLRWIGRFTPDVFATGFHLLDEALRVTGEAPTGISRIAKDGSSSVSVSWADQVRLDTLQGVSSTETVRKRLLDERPELRKLAERVNLWSGLYFPALPYGLPRDEASQAAGERFVSRLWDRSYRAFLPSRSSPEMMSSSINLGGGSIGSGPSLANRLELGSTTPSWRATRSQLKRELGTFENFDLLFRYADSKLLAEKCRKEALKIALDLLVEAREPVLRARLLTGILPLERRFGDKASYADRIADARTLLVQLRESPPSAIGGAGPDGIRLAIDAFERVVVSEWAWLDYSDAMSYAAGLSGFNRFAVYLDTARLLSQSRYYRNWPTP